MKKFIMIFVIILGLGVVLTYKMFSLADVECDVCITFKGVQLCRTALGPDNDEASTEAHRNACAEIAQGVTEVVKCNALRRDSVACRQP